MVNMPLPKEAKEALTKTATMADDLTAIRGCLERLLELEEKRAAQEQG